MIIKYSLYGQSFISWYYDPVTFQVVYCGFSTLDQLKNHYGPDHEYIRVELTSGEHNDTPRTGRSD